jgi:hypothetical protein
MVNIGDLALEPHTIAAVCVLDYRQQVIIAFRFISVHGIEPGSDRERA